MKKLLLLTLLVSMAFSQAIPTLIDSVKMASTISAGRVFVVQMTATEYLTATTTAAGIRLNTFTLDGSFNITSNGEDAQLAAAGTGNPFLLKLADGYFMSTWESGTVTWIKTFSATKSGTWSFVTIDEVQITAKQNSYPGLVHLTGNYYAGCQRNSTATDGTVFTFSTDGAYDNITYIDDLTHSTDGGHSPDITVIDATHFISTYADIGNDGWVATFSVDASANNITELDEFEWELDGRKWTHIEQADDASHYVLGMYGAVGAGVYIETIVLDGSYLITPIDSLEVDVVGGNYPVMEKLTNTLYAFNSTTAAGGNMRIGSFDIDGSYEISTPGALQHQANATYSELARIDDTHAMVIYANIADADLVVKTYGFTGVSTGWAHTIGGINTPTSVGGITDPTSVGGI